MTTVDLIMEYIKWRNSILNSIFARLFYNYDILMSMGIVELYENIAVRIRVDMEYELHYFRDYEKPASWVYKIRFYDYAQPKRPRYPTFTNEVQEFPLRHTIDIFTCPTCGGRGVVPCPTCNGMGKVTCPTCLGDGLCTKCGGTGRITCSYCGGWGEVYTTKLVEQTCPSCGGTGYVLDIWGEKRTCFRCLGKGVITVLARVKVTCPRCLGSGKVTCNRCLGTGKCTKCGGTGKVICSTCHGTGFVTCSRCKGEGKLLSYKSEIYEYVHRYRIEDVLPELPENMIKVYNKTVPSGSIKLKKWDLQELISLLEMFNKHIENQYRNAATMRNAIIDDLKKRGGRVLYHDETYYVTPLGYLNISVGKRRSQFWYVGIKGKHAVVPMRPPLDSKKTTFFLLLLISLFNIILLLATGNNLLSLLFTFNYLYNIIFSILLLVIVVIAEIRIIRKPLYMERTILITGPAKIGKTTYFTLLALYISKIRLGEVIDEYYPIFLKILTGETPHRNISLTCLIKMRDGHYIRIIDLKSKSYEKLDADFESAVKYSNCIIILQDPSVPDDNLRNAVSKIRSINPQAKVLICYNEDISEKEEITIPIWRIREEYINGLTTPTMRKLLVPIEVF